jgi:hypothetical protein
MKRDFTAPHEVLTTRGYFSRIVPGTIALLIGISFFNSWANPLEEFFLINYKTKTTAKVLGAEMEYVEGDRGEGHYESYIEYVFHDAQGKQIKSRTRNVRSELNEIWSNPTTRPKEIEIEYYDRHPDWNRLAGSGGSTNLEFFAIRLPLMLILLGFSLSIGYSMIATGINEIKQARGLQLKSISEKRSATEVACDRIYFSKWLSATTGTLILLGIFPRNVFPPVVLVCCLIFFLVLTFIESSFD